MAKEVNVLKVVHVVPAISEEASGPSYSVRRLCDALVAQGHDITLASLDWGRLVNPPAYIRTFPLGLGPKRLGTSPEMRRWLRHSVAHGGVSVVHNHGMWQMNSVYPAWAVKGTVSELVYSPRGALSKWALQHGSTMKRAFWPLLQRPALARATCFHATAESEYDDIRRAGFRQPVMVIPNGIDLPVLPPKQSDGLRTLLFLGRIHVVKGLDVLLPAWLSLQRQFPEWRLVIVGSDDGYNGVSGHLKEMIGLADRLGLERVEFAGPIYGARKIQAFRDADLYVLPSRSENFAVTVAEALACGTPAVVSKGAPWAGLDSKCAGWWTDIDSESLYASLQHAMTQSAAELSVMGERGRRWMNDDFTWESVGAQMSEVYRWLGDRTMETPKCVRLD